MKVINLSKKDFKYQTKGQIIVLTAGEITEVDDTLVTPKKLRDCYGNRIRVIDENAIIEEYKAFSGDAKEAQPKPIKEPEEGTNEEGEGTDEDGDEGTKEPEENSDEEGTKTKGEKATKPVETKENKDKKQTGKKSSKNKNK